MKRRRRGKGDVLHLLGNAGVLVVENDVLVIDLSNKPGVLARLGKVLAMAGINIDYAYGGLNADDQSGVLYVRVSNVKKALELLTDF